MEVLGSLCAIAAGIVALYWVCVSSLYFVALAIDMEIVLARKQGGAHRSYRQSFDRGPGFDLPRSCVLVATLERLSRVLK